jgi:hypothetical protein
MRPFFLAITLALAVAAPAQAAEIKLGVNPSNGLQLGGEHRFSGTLTEAGAPLAGQVVTLEARRFPFGGEFTALDQATTGDQGQFVFFRELDRNHEIRVTASNATSDVRTAFVFPRFRLSFKSLSSGRVRLTQRYTTPDDTVLTERTYFYLGPRKGRLAPLRARVSTRQTGPGRFVATAAVRVPRSYRGRFRYASCLPGDPLAGMGDPAQSCSRRFRFR